MSLGRDTFIMNLLMVAVLGVGVVLAVFAVKDGVQWQQARRLRQESDIRECRSHGGLWTPVGGGGDRIIYGCVFPPR